MKKLLPILLVLTACQRAVYVKELNVDPAFKPYISVFEEESLNQGRPIVVDNLYAHFASPYLQMSDTVLGECLSKDHGIGGTPVILINKTQWDQNSQEYNEIVFLHELGHCCLWRSHITTHNGPQGNITSIMYPYILWDTSIYLDHWNYYMRELFQGE